MIVFEKKITCNFIKCRLTQKLKKKCGGAMLCAHCMSYKSRNDSGRQTAYVCVYSSKVQAVLNQSGLSDLSLYLRDCSPFSGSVRNTTRTNNFRP